MTRRMSWSREDMVRRAAAEVEPGQIVNLGIGMPTEVANHIPPDGSVMLHSENGLLGMGPFPTDDQVDPQLINAGKQTVTALPGASIVRFGAVVRDDPRRPRRPGGAGRPRGRLHGDLANWTVPGKLITGMGGAMDLAAGARRLSCCKPRLEGWQAQAGGGLTLPPTALGCANRVITELGIFDPRATASSACFKAPGVSREMILGATGAPVLFTTVTAGR